MFLISLYVQWYFNKNIDYYFKSNKKKKSKIKTIWEVYLEAYEQCHSAHAQSHRSQT